MLLVIMVLMMVLNALMVLLERYALRWRPETTVTIHPQVPALHLAALRAKRLSALRRTLRLDVRALDQFD
jgi:hypothetical protein